MGIPEPPKDKLIDLTLSFCTNRTSEVSGQEKLTVIDKQKLAKAVVAILLAIPLLSIVYGVISLFIEFKESSFINLFEEALIIASTISVCVLIFIFLYPRILKKN